MSSTLPISIPDLLPRRSAYRRPFDDDNAVGFSVEDLSSALVREFLKETGREDLLAESDPLQVYRQLGLTRKTNGREVPRNVALLFFNNNPEEIFPSATIQVGYFDDTGGDRIEEHNFRGPVHRPVQSCLQHLLNGIITFARIHTSPSMTPGRATPKRR